MGFIELFLIAIGLSADAFAVAVCKGLNMKKVNGKIAVIIGLFFGGFQALMPLIGWVLGKQFERYIVSFDHWVAFFLLALIGANMIREAFSKEEECADNCYSVKSMFVMAVATSIDALAIGITFAVLPDVNVFSAVLLIGVITFLLSGVGVKIGNIFGAKYKAKAEFVGGAILVLIGLKILLEHLGVITL